MLQVRLTPEELASQELAEWRDQESKYQLELIKKSELDLLAASKTYVLKTHKGEEASVPYYEIMYLHSNCYLVSSLTLFFLYR